MKPTSKEFLTAIYGNDDAEVYLRSFIENKAMLDAGVNPRPENSKCKIKHLHRVQEYLEKLNNEGHGIFFVVNSGGHRDPDIKYITAHFMEIDGIPKSEQWELIKSFALEPSIIIETKKSLHCYWLIVKGEVKRFRHIQERLIKHFGSDEGLKNESHTMRMPNFYHVKQKPFMVECVKFDPDLRYTQDRLLEVLKDDAPMATTTSPMADVVEGKTHQGERNNTLFTFALSLVFTGVRNDIVLEMARQYNQTHLVPPLPDAEVVTIVDSACGYLGKHKPTMSNFANFCIAKDCYREYPDLIQYETNDDGNAKRLKTMYGDKVRFCYDIDRWLIWNGKTWDIDRTGKIKDLAIKTNDIYHEQIKTLCNELYKENGEHPTDILELSIKIAERIRTYALGCGNDKKIDAQIEILKVDVGIQVSQDQLDQNHDTVATKNWLYHIPSGRMLPHDKSQYITKMIEYNFDPDARCPAFHKTVDAICVDTNGNHDPELKNYLLCALGYSITGCIKEQCFFLGVGNGSNGKTTLFNIVGEVFAPYTQTLSADSITKQMGDVVTKAELHKAYRKRFTVISELAEGSPLNEGTIKAITGGDPVVAKEYYQSPYTYKPTIKIWIGTNHYPKITGVDYGIWRRIRVIPFNACFTGKRDNKDLMTELRAEKPGILTLLLKSATEYMKNGLPYCKAVADATRFYREDSDTVKWFLDGYCEQSRESISANALYYQYIRICDRFEKETVTPTKFGNSLTQKGIQKKRTAKGIEYLGIKFNPPKTDENVGGVACF